MKMLTGISAFALAVLLSVKVATAADYDAQVQQLVVSGVVEKWTGYTFADLDAEDPNDALDEDSFFASSAAGRLSLPLGSNLSVQMDASIEYAEGAFDASDNSNLLGYGSQLGLHLTYRDPASFALGGFGAFGGGSTEGEPFDGFIVGGEAQIYVDDITLYAQAGFLDSTDRSGSPGNALHDAVFVRGVGRWYMTPGSRLQGEFGYASGNQDSDNDDMDVVAWGVRYDTVVPALPILGDTHVFVGYRGNWTEVTDSTSATERSEYVDHTIMVGSRMSFGGSSMLETERVGAGLDLPDFTRWIGFGPIVD